MEEGKIKFKKLKCPECKKNENSPSSGERPLIDVDLEDELVCLICGCRMEFCAEDTDDSSGET